MIFFFAPTGQFLLGIFYYGEHLDINKLVSFVIIWIAVGIYLQGFSRNDRVQLNYMWVSGLNQSSAILPY